MANKNDDLFEDIITRQVQILRVDASFRGHVLRDLKKLQNEILTKLRDSDIGTSLQRRRLNALLTSVNGIIDEIYRQIDTSFQRDVTQLAVLEAAKTINVLNATVQVDTASLPLEKINVIYGQTLIEGALTREWWKRQSESLKGRFADNMREGLLRGEPNSQLVRRVRGTRAFNFTDGLMQTTRREAEALVRTSVQAVTNETRVRVFDANSDLIKSYKHVSTLDTRTSTICVARDGLRWKSNDRKGIGHGIPYRIPPLHWNCRSVLIPELEGVTLADDAQRASADGAVKASITFDKFLKGKSKAFQDDLLGGGRAQLWREGKIALRQLLDTSGNPLTLAQLKEKYDL